MTPLSNRGWLAAAAWGVAVLALLYVAEQCLAGYVQCRVLGCLPW